MRIPRLSSELISYLDELIPNRLPELDWSDRRIWFEAGRRSLVDTLVKSLETDEENILEKPIV